MSDKYHLIVIGSGPGGYVAAIRASQLGFKAAVIEHAELGGVCLNWGCIPTKTLIHCADLYQQMKHSKGLGITCSDINFDFSAMVRHSREVADRLSKGIDVLFRKKKITHVAGRGRILPGKRVEVTRKGHQTQFLEANNMLPQHPH